MLKIYPIGVISPCPRMYKIMKKIYINSEFKAVFPKLAANDQSSKSLLCCFKLTPCIISPAQEQIFSEIFI